MTKNDELDTIPPSPLDVPLDGYQGYAVCTTILDPASRPLDVTCYTLALNGNETM